MKMIWCFAVLVASTFVAEGAFYKSPVSEDITGILVSENQAAREEREKPNFFESEITISEAMMDKQDEESEAVVEEQSKEDPKVPHSFLVKRRYRRSFGTSSQCQPITVKKCKVFSFNGLTKPICAYVKQQACFGLD